ncbi:uncharacterized protein V1510DRAFT_408124 [Dipodascopsis tothii]|uniref:uncharacterized protein n=1 Tax=Dipodascopsis tothii TaxID=44089 RepID=UPI0034CD9AEE
MADDYNYEIDIYDDDALEDAPPVNAPADEPASNASRSYGSSGKLDQRSCAVWLIAVKRWLSISVHAATAVKKYIENLSHSQVGGGMSKFNVTYFSPNVNPFRTLPKDPPSRGHNNSMNNMGRGGNMNNMGRGMRGGGGYNNNNMGGRGGYNNMNNQGGRNNMMGNNGGNMPYNGNMGMPFGGMPMGMFGFNGQGNMNGMMGRGGGNMMGRGGRANMEAPRGFPQPHFNPAFFGPDGNQGGGNPHGNKRQRPE